MWFFLLGKKEKINIPFQLSSDQTEFHQFLIADRFIMKKKPYCDTIFYPLQTKKKTLEIPVSKMIFLEQAMPRLFSGVRTMRLISTNTSEIQNTKITKQKPEFIDIINSYK